MVANNLTSMATEPTANQVSVGAMDAAYLEKTVAAALVQALSATAEYQPEDR